ncbi:MAG: hypothetical protein IJT96_06565 [Lachnospiraceae bacterium]|nr:hypothetical protein [Lachnospiraceae bacterium]
MLKTESGNIPALEAYIDRKGGHDGFDISYETKNCQYIENPPSGLPTRYRKTEDYKLISNKTGVYMFGNDASQLMTAWNEVMCVQER